MRTKKVLVLVLALAMLAGSIVGCGSNAGGQGDAGSAPAEVADTPAEAAEAPEEAAPAANEEVVTLKWVTVGNGMPTNYETWKATLNEYLAQEIGVNLEMEVIPWGDWDNRRNVIISTNEPYDIIFGNPNNYSKDISIGAYLDITDMLETNMGGLYGFMPLKFWDAMTAVDGRIYGVPTYKDSSLTNYMIWDKELVDEYSLDIASMTTLESLTPAFETLKADKNDFPVYVKNDGVYQIFDVYDGMGLGNQALGVRYDDAGAQVCFTLEQPDVYGNLMVIRDWYQKGIVNTDAATLSEGRVYNMWRVAQGWPSAGATAWGPQMGKEVVVQQWGDTILSNDTVRGSFNSISANSQYAEKCLQLLDLVNMDTKVRDWFYYGEEGVNFEYNAEGKVHKINEEWTLAGYTQATFFNVTQNEVDAVNQWDEVKALNEAAVPSVLLGFSADMTGLEIPLANCLEIWLRYKSEVINGVQDPATIVPQIKEELMSAGFQDILDNLQAQVDAFMSSK